jgi:hypothetical protein
MSTPASHLWHPSTARLLRLDGFAPAPRGVPPCMPSPQAWPIKDPEDVLDYLVDLSPALVGNDNDTVATLDVSINPSNTGDLSLVSASVDDPRLVIWLSSGRPGVTYRVTVRVSLASGRQIARDFLLPVGMLATPVDGNDLLAGSGGPITSSTGTLTTD